MVIIIMGVSGCGKTTIGQALAQKLSWPFYDADDFHSNANVDKMKQGIPLTDEDRMPWLHTLANMIQEWNQQNRNAILACSALKVSYRRLLGVDQKKVVTVYLKGAFSLIQERMLKREHHFMNPDLLKSQLETLEAPDDGLVVGIESQADQIVAQILSALRSNPIEK